MLTQMLLPLLSGLMLIAFLWLFGKKALWLSAIPAVLGAAFFMVRAFGLSGKGQTIGAVFLTAIALAVYICTVFGVLRNKWPLVLLFLLSFVLRLLIRDVPVMREGLDSISFAAGMQESGILCVLSGMTALALVMKKEIVKRGELEQLPPIRAPKVVPPRKEKTQKDKLNSADSEEQSFGEDTENADDRAKSGTQSGTMELSTESQKTEKP